MIQLLGLATLAGCSPGRGLSDEKSEVEQLVNPFGDPWSSRGSSIHSIPIATSSLLRYFLNEPYDQTGRFDAEGKLNLSKDYARYIRNASSPFHYDESIAKLADDMPQFRLVKAAFEAAGLSRKFIGYTTVNFAETPAMAGYAEADETFFLHVAGAEPTYENRLQFADSGALQAGGHIFDIRNVRFGEYIAEKFVNAMDRNGLDAVLIDYAANQFPFGSRFSSIMPEDWFATFEENQTRLLQQITSRATQSGKLIFCNGISLDGLYETAIEKARLFLEACHGAFWEQPFRSEWRDTGGHPDAYYDKLGAFFALANRSDRTIIVKQGTYRFHGDESQDPTWNWRFALTSRDRERELMKYLLAFYLLFAEGEKTPLIYTHPTELLDIFASEAYFKEFDMLIGKAISGRIKLADHVFYRQFEKALVVLNNSDAPFASIVPTGRRSGPMSFHLLPQSGAILRHS